MTFPSERMPLTTQSGMSDSNKESSLRWGPAGTGHPLQNLRAWLMFPNVLKPWPLVRKGNSCWEQDSRYYLFLMVPLQSPEWDGQGWKLGVGHLEQEQQSSGNRTFSWKSLWQLETGWSHEHQLGCYPHCRPWHPQHLPCCVLCQASSHPSSKQKGCCDPSEKAAHTNQECLPLSKLNCGVKGTKH